jgi:cell division protein FtsB
MQIIDRQIDDFKTDRKDISPPLPVVLRLVPILFFCSIAFTVIFSALFFLQFRIAIHKRDRHRAQAAALATQTQQSRNERSALEAQIQKATDIQSWVTGSQPLQPLVVEIARSIGPKASILDLRLDRVAEDPSQIRMNLTVGTDTTKQLDLTMERIAALDFRAFSPTRELGRGELSYKATLVRRNEQTTPEAPATGTP